MERTWVSRGKARGRFCSSLNEGTRIDRSLVAECFISIAKLRSPFGKAWSRHCQRAPRTHLPGARFPLRLAHTQNGDIGTSQRTARIDPELRSVLSNKEHSSTRSPRSQRLSHHRSNVPPT